MRWWISSFLSLLGGVSAHVAAQTAACDDATKWHMMRVRSAVEIDETLLFTTLNKSAMFSKTLTRCESPHVLPTCQHSLACELPLHSHIAARLSIHVHTNNSIPCSSWLGRRCSSASELLAAHGCESIRACPGCCVADAEEEAIPWYVITTVVLLMTVGALVCTVGLANWCRFVTGRAAQR